MPAHVTTPRFPTSLPHALVLALLALPYCLNLGSSSLWDANEAFYAETPREMIESGNYLAPAFNYQARPQKPPLTYWAVLASYKIFGVREFSVRLPGALAAVGTLILVFGMGRMLYSPFAGLAAAAICSTTPRFFVVTRKLPIDALLLFWLAATAFCIVRAITARSRRSWLAAYACAGLGFMTKGPVAVVIPAGALLLWGLWSRRSVLRQTRPLAGAAVFLAVILPWYSAIYVTHGWTYITPFFLRDNLGRFASESFGPARGPFYYLPIYLADFFPWSLLSLAAVAHLWQGRKRHAPFADPATGFPLVWGALVLVLFSLSKNKQEYYIAASYPLLAVFLGGMLDRLRAAGPACGAGTQPPRTAPDPALCAGWGSAAALAALVMLAISLVAAFAARAVIPELPGMLHYAAPAVLLASALAMAWQLARFRIAASIVVMAAGLWTVFTLTPVVYLPALEQFRPVKELCEAIRDQAQPGDEAGYFRATVPSMVYYLRRPIFEEFDADAMVRRLQSPQRVFCIMTEQDQNYLAGTRDQILYILDRRARLVTRLRGLFDQNSWAQQELVLVSNRPSTEAPARGAQGIQ